MGVNVQSSLRVRMTQPVLQFFYDPSFVNQHGCTTKSKFVERDFWSAKFFCRFLKQLRNIVGIIRSSIFLCKNVVIYIFVIPLKKVLFRSCSKWIFKRHFQQYQKDSAPFCWNVSLWCQIQKLFLPVQLYG